jgi:hypothetical protein
LPAPEADDPTLHELVERKLVRVFGPERGAALLRSLLAELRLGAVRTTGELHRVADLLQTHPGFERTAGAMLAVMAAVRDSAGR